MRYLKSYKIFEEYMTDDGYITNNDLEQSDDNVWAVFKVSYGEKFFISRLFKKDKRWQSAKRRYSDPEVLKFSEDEAIEIIEINKGARWEKWGMCDDKGNQKLIYDGYERVLEGKLEDDYTWWFGENTEISPLINAIKIRIKELSPNHLDEFYYRITNDENPELVISEIYKKSNISDSISMDYLNELKRRNKRANQISRINNNNNKI